jgi:hypothetical protein
MTDKIPLLEGATEGPWQIVPYGDGDSLVICAMTALAMAIEGEK